LAKSKLIVINVDVTFCVEVRFNFGLNDVTK